MRLGFVGLQHPHGTHSYYETPFCMAAALKRQGCSIPFALQLKMEDAALVNLRNKMTRMITGQHIVCERDARVVRHYPEQINAAVRQHQVDALLGTSPFYMVTRNCPVPSIFWADTTVAGMISRSPYYTHLTKGSIRDCHSVEQRALDSCALAVFSSQWAADVACESYNVDPCKVRVIPYGANLSTRLNPADIATCLRRRDESDWELLFVSVEWEPKAAQIAVDATTALRARGINARLSLVGCRPPRTIRFPDYVAVIGRIDRSSLKGQALLSALYMQSHLLILPSPADCVATFLAEAGAHGVPSLSTNAGANNTLVKDGINGYLLPAEAGQTEYANYALQLLADPGKYAALCWSSFQYFQTELNWDVAVSRLLVEINSVLNPADQQYACSRAS